VNEKDDVMRRYQEEFDGKAFVVEGSSGTIYLSEPIEELNPKSGRPLSPVATRTRVLEERYKNPHICRKM